MAGLGTLLSVGMELPNAVDHAKRYKAQLQAGKRKINAPHAPGGAPPMRKVSAAEGLRASLKKVAAPSVKSMFNSQLGSAMITGAGFAATGAALAGASRGVGSMYQNMQAERMYKTLTQKYPEIKRQKKSREYFDLIVSYAPSLLRHHVAVGDFLKRQLEYPSSSIEFIKQLADLESTVVGTESKSQSSQFGQNVAQAGKLTGLFME